MCVYFRALIDFRGSLAHLFVWLVGICVCLSLVTFEEKSNQSKQSRRCIVFSAGAAVFFHWLCLDSLSPKGSHRVGCVCVSLLRLLFSRVKTVIWFVFHLYNHNSLRLASSLRQKVLSRSRVGHDLISSTSQGNCWSPGSSKRWLVFKLRVCHDLGAGAAHGEGDKCSVAISDRVPLLCWCV